MIATGLAIVATALAAVPLQEIRIEPGVSVPLDPPTVAYARGQLRDAKAAVAARRLDLTCIPYGGFKGADTCDALPALFRVMDERDFAPMFVGPCYGGARTRCIALQHRRDVESYIEVMIRFEPSETDPAAPLRMTSVEIVEGQYNSD